jgi:hypothetical protein
MPTGKKAEIVISAFFYEKKGIGDLGKSRSTSGKKIG